MKAKTIVGVVAVCVAIALTATAVFAAISLVERSTKAKGATTIDWDSSFADTSYTLGDTINMTVTWDVNSGAASYDDFGLKVNKKGKGGFSPRGNDPAAGIVDSVAYPGSSGANSVDVSFRFTALHLDRVRNVETGNAHFKLYLMVDVDGDGATETKVGYGVNVHVEDPQ